MIGVSRAPSRARWLVLVLLAVAALLAQSPATAQLKAWGENDNGRLGDGTTIDRLTPVSVGGLTDVVAFTGGWYHSLAAKSDGTVWAWGYNFAGQLGDNTLTQRVSPVQVKGPGGVGFLTDVVQVAGGFYHSMALKSDGTVWAWGWNSAGQLGDGTNVDRTTPVQVKGPGGVGFLTDVVQIASGYNSGKALKSDGTVWTWGDNLDGQLGDGTNVDRTTPVQVKGPGGVGFLTGVTAIASGETHSLALISGTVWAWGDNFYGQLGDGTFLDSMTPVPVSGLSGVVQITGGASHSLALKSDGTAWSWGRNLTGQLGDGTLTNRPAPVAVVGLTGVVQVAGGGFHSLALKSDGTAWSWGMNYYGQLGDNSLTSWTTPVQVKGPGGVGFLTGVTGIAAGTWHSFGLVPINDPPTADAGADQTVTVPHDGSPTTDTADFTLLGNGFDPNLFDTLTYEWKEGTTSLGTTASLSLSRPAGTYTFTLTVTDNHGASASDTVTVTVHPEPNQPPAANAGPDQSVTIAFGDTTKSFTLDGSGSSDPDGDSITYVWRLLGGRTPIVVGTTATISQTKAAGTYTYTLTVTDPYGASHTDTVVVTVNPAPPNGPPTADAGADQTVTVPHDGSPTTDTADFTLLGNGSDQNAGDTLTYEWKEGATSLGTTASLSLSRPAGTYTFTLTVTDNHGASASDTVTVTVHPEPNGDPVADAGADQTVTIAHGDTTKSFTLDGSGSSDPEGDTLTYEWKEGATVVGTSATLSQTKGAGTYTYTLTVTDPYGASHTDTVVVTVNSAENANPVADAGDDQTVTVAHDGDPATNTASFTLDGSGSSDPDGDTLTYEWKEGATVVGTSASLTLSRIPGSYTFTLTVSDPYGASSTDTVVVTVHPESNGDPVADAGDDQTVTVAHDGNPATNTAGFTLTGTGSDADGDTLAYEWKEGTASLGTAASISLSRPAGTYTFTLTVTDSYGASSTDTVTVIVHPESNQPPAANAGPDQSVTIASGDTTKSFTLDGSGSSDPEGDTLTYEWKEGATVVGTSATLSQTKGAGTYTYTLTVTDPYGASHTDTVVVTVHPAPGGDTTPPTIGCLNVDKDELWPPNHKMVLVTVTHCVTDNVDPNPTVSLSVTSNEPQNGLGDGDTDGDWVVVDANHVWLRAERSGKGNGRIYTITLTATDSSGNRSSSQVTVKVPKSQGK